MAKLNHLLAQIRQLWVRMTRQQRLIVAGALMAAVLGFGYLAKTMETPDYKPLMTGLEPGDAQAIEQQLVAKKIDFQVSPDGKNIDVPASQLDAARMEVVAQGPTHSGRMGFELFDKSGWGQTEFDEKVNYQRALEGELERTIGTLSGVRSARVHLVMPRDSVFLVRERPAKASVTLRLKRGSLGDEQLEAIARLVGGAVENLSPNDVAIIDADSNEPLGKHGGAQGHELEDALSKRLLATLGPAVGAENLRATVNVEYDPTSVEENEDKYDPTVSALLTTQKTSEKDGQTATGGVAGTSSNIPSNQPADAVDDGSGGTTQASNTESSTFGVNKLVRHTIAPAGRIRRITAAILVNDASDPKVVDGKLVGSVKKRSPDELRQIQMLAQSAIGSDLQRGDVVTVEEMAFSGDDPGVPTFGEKLQKSVNDYAVPLRYASLLLLFVLGWALIWRPLQKQLLLSLQPGKGMRIAEIGAGEAVVSQGLPAQTDDSFLELLEGDINSVGLKRKLSELAQTEPVAMARTVQSWIRESKG